VSLLDSPVDLSDMFSLLVRQTVMEATVFGGRKITPMAGRCKVQIRLRKDKAMVELKEIPRLRVVMFSIDINHAKARQVRIVFKHIYCSFQHTIPISPAYSALPMNFLFE
jgi:hypothetical protein